MQTATFCVNAYDVRSIMIPASEIFCEMDSN